MQSRKKEILKASFLPLHSYLASPSTSFCISKGEASLLAEFSVELYDKHIITHYKFLDCWKQQVAVSANLQTLQLV